MIGGGNDMMKHIKKGFTLIELIVVMAIFSILMVGVMVLIDPVSNMFKNTAMSEKTYAYANNVQQYLQTKLEYAEDVFVGSSGKMGLTTDGGANSEKLAEYVENFRKNHFNEVVYTTDGENVNYVNGKIHVVRLVNKDGKMAGGTAVKKGQITQRVYTFNSKEDATVDKDDFDEEVAELNPAFLDAKDAAYDFSYSLGVSKLVSKDKSDLSPVTPGALKSGADYKVLDKDYSNSSSEINAARLALSIVLNKKSSGTVECVNSAGVVPYNYTAFTTPCAVQVVNLPLTNIAHRNGRSVGAGVGQTRPMKDPTDGKVRLQTAGDSGYAFSMTSLDDTVDFDQDIYFIYCFTDEIDS